MVVDVATEDDVLWTVRYCIHNSIPFLAQNGGNAWSTTFHLPRQTSAFIGRISPNDTYSAVVNTTASNSTNILTAQLPSSILINLRNLNNISFSLPPVITTYNTTSTNATVTIGGGVLISDLVTAAHAHSVQIQTGNCNCVGMLGALLGGGYSRFQGLYGLGVDNILSVNMITAAGELLTIGAKEEEEEGSIQGKSKNDADTGTDDDTTAKEDLWWAIRGAGPNFGIITSATLKAYPMPDKSKSGAWLATLLFDESKLEQLVSAMEALDLGAHMAIFLYFFAPLPDCTPSIVAELFYANTDALTARAAFRSIYDVGGWREDAASTGFKEYDKVNEGSEMFCAKDGARKPTYGAGLAHVSPVAMRAIWEEYKAFLKVGGMGRRKVRCWWRNIPWTPSCACPMQRRPIRGGAG
ncbi:uncharacterized protein KY384_004612 [Bacidia gigantensis]|uniref:uncharacterized protein n=1 Tax=Bacidia gigantensis TaxID=2732470 RepID=UPI001D04CD53|nr:uncharacterized protein KY384_004612 [Bacidia gigantensis]KAG8531254.1 hypothetical protein KY384_004612 [Bacidia gigantensis]